MKTRRTQSWLIIAALAIAAPILSGCTGASTVLTASWPGLAVENNTIYLSYAKVYSLGLDGTPKWSFPDPNHQLQSGQAFFAPPASNDKLVVVSDYTDSVFGLDPASGQEQWVFKTNKSRIIGGPVMGDKYIYAASADGILHAIDASSLSPSSSGEKTAKEAWSFTTEGSIWSTPLLDSGTLYVTSMDKHVYALDAETGKLQWKYPDQNSAPENPALGGIVGAPALHKGVLYFSSFNNRLYALDVETHKILWRYTTENWVWGSPVVDDSTGYVIAADLNGNIFAIDPAGSNPEKPVWKVTAKPPPGGLHASVVGSPALRMLADGTPAVYVGSDSDPDLYVLKVKDGSNALPASPKSLTYTTPTTFLFWETGGTNPPLPLKLYPSPVFSDDTLYLATSEGPNALYSLDANSLEYKSGEKPIATKDVDTALLAKTNQPQPDNGILGNPQTLLFMLVIFLVVTLVLRPGPQGGKK